jgi:hypothetical protein
MEKHRGVYPTVGLNHPKEYNESRNEDGPMPFPEKQTLTNSVAQLSTVISNIKLDVDNIGFHLFSIDPVENVIEGNLKRSVGDEIEFLKSEASDILKKLDKINSNII